MQAGVKNTGTRKLFSGASKQFLFLLLLVLSGCDQQASIAAAEPAKPLPIQFPDLQSLNGKAAIGLTKDQVIALHIYTIVPVVRYECMKDLFRHMRDLEITADGTLQSDASGSRADSLRSGYFALAPTGDMDIVLQCENGKFNHRLFQYFTTKPATIAAPAHLMAWLRMHASLDDEIRRTDHAGVNDFDYAAIERTALTGVANRVATKPNQTQKAAPVEQHYVAAGGVICTNPGDFNRVNAVERSGNPYAQLPATCETLGEDLPVNFIRSVNNLFLVGNEGGTAFVRIHDFR